MSWARRGARDRVEFEDFDPEKEDYTGSELEDFADALLREDAKENNPINGEHPILFDEHLYNRRRREILVESGIPDDSLHIEKASRPGAYRDTGAPMFNRTHPRGRKVNSEEQRKKNGASFYR